MAPTQHGITKCRSVKNKSKEISVASDSQTNYTDWSTATGRRILVPELFYIKRCRVVSAAEPPRPLISVFWNGAITFLSSSSSFIFTRAEWTPFQTHCYSGNLVAPGIEPGISLSAARDSAHRTTEAVSGDSIKYSVINTEGFNAEQKRGICRIRHEFVISFWRQKHAFTEKRGYCVSKQA
jgi:hypothetical protein